MQIATHQATICGSLIERVRRLIVDRELAAWAGWTGERPVVADFDVRLAGFCKAAVAGAIATSRGPSAKTWSGC
jgi:hypothetical protein